jgi:hypothetical protein
MAVNVNTVYQKVLALANKEQRGYITPQEFNLFAEQAQLDIFEAYFNDLDRFLRMASNDTVYADKVDAIQERINVFKKYHQTVDMTAGSGVGTLPAHYKLGKLIYSPTNSNYGSSIGVLTWGLNNVEVQLIDQNKLHYYLNSAYLNPTTRTPIYVKTSETTIQVYPTAVGSTIVCNLISKPLTPKWTYVVVNNKALYNSSASDAQNFELHEAEENNLVMRILELSGITLKDQALTQTALRDQAVDKSEKNN